MHIGNLIKTTHWHRIVSWDQKKNPFLVDRVKRGDLVFVEGPIHYRSYTAKDGTEKQLTEITLSTTHHHSEEINFCLLIQRKKNRNNSKTTDIYWLIIFPFSVPNNRDFPGIVPQGAPRVENDRAERILSGMNTRRRKKNTSEQRKQLK